MKTKSFKSLLEKRLSKSEIAEIEAAAQIEFEALKTLQEDVSKALVHYMSENDVGFNELVRRLGKSPSQVSKIIKGEANLTLATVAQIYALMGCRAHLVAA
jgi:transcriptional regulator with XRE-family HTH domain